jgi:hypothetical protein
MRNRRCRPSYGFSRRRGGRAGGEYSPIVSDFLPLCRDSADCGEGMDLVC